MYGAIIAFKDFSPAQGILGSPWLGLQNFADFFGSVYVWRLLRNTLAINVLDVVLGFPAPIILALLLNELTSAKFKRLVQTITYLPHFMSLVVVVGILIDFLARDGLFNNIVASVGIAPTPNAGIGIVGVSSRSYLSKNLRVTSHNARRWLSALP